MPGGARARVTSLPFLLAALALYYVLFVGLYHDLPLSSRNGNVPSSSIWIDEASLGLPKRAEPHPTRANKNETAPITQVDQQRNILFLHIGKSGGESVRKALRFGCDSIQGCPMKRSRLFEQVQDVWHMNIWGFARQKAMIELQVTSFLYNLRFPVDRAVSSYWFHNPLRFCPEGSRRDGSCAEYIVNNLAHLPDIANLANHSIQWRFYVDCFPEVEDLAQSIAITSKHNRSSCHRMALGIVTGCYSNFTGIAPSDFNHTVAHLGLAHLSVFNYRHYANKSLYHFPEKEVLVVRTENLWDDMRNLDVFLGGNGDLGDAEGVQVTHNSEAIINKLPLTASGNALLCCALLDELNVYRDILFRAVNLNSTVKESTWSNGLEKCGATTWEELQQTCESLVDMPLVKSLLEERWGRPFL